ncbi:hypothetical protein [Streptomyces sp. NPDC007088]|uniref:hypothetical protein n=1 Tax=Streptomyces sp. NPDC007088 TaxID=3364773 RepID=UPI003690A9DD
MNFRLKNVTTGKCLQWNGVGKAATAVKCSTKTRKQLWGWSGDHLATLAVPLPGQDCIVGSTKYEKSVKGGGCFGRTTNWVHSQGIGGKKTVLANSVSGYLKVTTKNKVIAGKRVNGDRDQWKLI